MNKNMINIDEAVEIFHRHAKEILRAVRNAPRGFRVIAEVGGDGTWHGVQTVTPGTGSLLAHEGRGYAISFSANRFGSRYDVADRIYEWREAQVIED